MTTKELLSKTQLLCNKLNESNSTLDKKEVLKNFANDSEILKLLTYTYSDYKIYNITSKNCLKHLDKVDTLTEYDDIFHILDDLNERKITGNKAIYAYNGFVSKYEEYKDLLYNIIDRNLKARVATSLINKVYPGTIEEFSCALAASYDWEKTKIDWDKDVWVAERKLNGCRCITFIDEDLNVKFSSRKGKEFFTLNKVRDAILNLPKEKLNYLKGMTIDGEICLVEENGIENFNGIMSHIRRKNHTMPNPRYKIFDIMSTSEFVQKSSDINYLDRLDNADFLLHGDDSGILDVIECQIMHSDQDLLNFMDYATEQGWEGLILRKNRQYEGKRTKNMYKCKLFEDAEYKVLSLETGPIRVIEDGKEVEREMVSNLEIEHKGNKVSVGSGLSIEQRKEWFVHPEKILNKIITVKYKEETKNKNGTISLQFPVLTCVHGDKREV